ncbi:N-acetylneuraminate synthase family protein [Myxococcota bacterium]|nr:N-acetylneuraminate synthase family protein [Myxococcota bacterium]MCZ7617283.1 N-acetylneuraminate synthase family protein [Myxococcota bacterium]
MRLPTSGVELETFQIGERTVGTGQPVYLIAEIGSNHDGDRHRAVELVRAAADAGADAVKFQSFTAAGLSRRGEPSFAQLERLALPDEWHRPLREAAHAYGIEFLSTPFSEERADFLAALGVPAFKIASGDLTHHALLQHVAGFGRPLLLSTGLAELAEVHAAVTAIRDVAEVDLALLHCVAAYPPQPEQMNLRSLGVLARQFAVPVGFSDHSPGGAATLAAVALGACVIERHVTFDRGLPGPDHGYALTFEEFAELGRSVRALEAALGTGNVAPAPCEKDGRALGRRSVHAARGLAAGTVLSPLLWKLVRPADGVPADETSELIGRRLVRDVAEDQPITWADVA